MSNSKKENKERNRGLVATIFLHIIYIIFQTACHFGAIEKLNLSISNYDMWKYSYIIFAVISFIMIIAFCLIIESRAAYIVINLCLPLGAICIAASTHDFNFFTMADMEFVSSIVYSILSFITSLGALFNWFKKKDKPESWRTDDVVVRKSIHEQIYDEYGNFGD